MGISVSVDSWIEQIFLDLSEKEYDQNDDIYRSLIESSNSVGEIMLVSPKILKCFIETHGNNVINVLFMCMQCLLSPETVIRRNSSSILIRIIPFLCSEYSTVNYVNFFLSNNDFFTGQLSPCSFIISSILDTIESIPIDDVSLFFEHVEYFIHRFDVIALSIFTLFEVFKNSTMIHQFVIMFEERIRSISSFLMNYIHMGGRSPSIIALIAILMLHPSSSLKSLSKLFITNGGKISNKLCNTHNNESDLICTICSLFFDESYHFQFFIQKDPHLLRVQYLKHIISNNESTDAMSLVESHKISQSPLCLAIASKINPIPSYFLSVSSDIGNLHCEFDPIVHHEEFIHLISCSFLSTKKLLFVGTNINVPNPSSHFIDSFVINPDV